jgi:hypothetical protein
VLAIDPEATLAFDLRASWQGRVLVEAKGFARMVVVSVLCHTFEEAVPILCAQVFPDFDGSLKGPILTSAAKIAKTGAVVADITDHNGTQERVLFTSELQMRDAFRRLADRLKLSDPDRIELFKCVQRWVVADRRLDPTFDPQDPDAKRLH